MIIICFDYDVPTTIKTCSKLTWSLSQISTELQDDSSRGTRGSKSSLTLTAEEDEVRITRFRHGFFLQERNTFKVPSTAGSKISICTKKNKHHQASTHNTWYDVLLESTCLWIRWRSEHRGSSVEHTMTSKNCIIKAAHFHQISLY